MIIYYNEKLEAKIRVFISSTFRDMQTERNVIVNGIFPLLRREYKNRSVDIMEVDLRWGITESDISNMTLLEICIGETLNCVPFFVGLIGEHYGTLAKSEEIKMLPNAYKRAIGMRSRDDLPVGVSLTELEMRAGAFVKENKHFSRFFLRDTEGERPEQLKRLKEKIVSEGFEYHTYRDVTEFESLVGRELRKLIDEHIPRELEAPYGDRHYVSHLKLLKRGSESYVPNDTFIESFEGRLKSSRAVYLYGGKGEGKTSAFCHLIYREGIVRDGDVFFHFADANEESINQDNLFNRLRRFLESHLGKRSNDVNDYNAIIELLKLTRLERPLVLYFDAIEKYNDNSLLNKLFSLSRMNDSVYVACSGAKDYKFVGEGERVNVMPLSEEQIRQISVRSLSNYGKKLSSDMMEALTGNPCCNNPLYLTALLSQLIAYGHHETFLDFFRELISKKSFDELFGVIIDRLLSHFAERGFGEDKVLPALALIAYSNMGVKESELSEIVDFLPIARSVLLSSLELFTSENDCTVKFSHDLIIRACRRLLSERGGYEESARRSIAAYFEKDPSSIRAYSELPYQYDRLGMRDKLRECILDRDCFVYLAKNQFNNLISYLSGFIDSQDTWIERTVPELTESEAPLAADVFCQAGCHRAALATISRAVGLDYREIDAARSESAVDELSRAIEASPLSTMAKVRLYSITSRSYYKLAINHYRNAERMYLASVDFYKRSFPSDEVGIATQSYLLGVTYKSMGDLEKAGRVLRECAEVYARYGVKNDISAWIMAVNGNLAFAGGAVKEARGYLKQSIEDNFFLFGEFSQELAWSNSYAWAIYYDNGEEKTAFGMARDAFAVYDELYHSRGSKVAWAASNIAACEHIMGSFSAAKEHYLLSIRENDAILPAEERPHTYTLTTYTNLAILLNDMGKREESIRCIEFTRRYTLERNGHDHIYTANILLVEGMLKRDPEFIAEAISIYELSKTPDLYFARACYARMLFAADREDEAEAEAVSLYREYMSSPRYVDFLTYVIAETYEKLSWDADADEVREIKDSLAKFKDYKYYVPLNNNSALIMIPHI